MPLLDLPRVAQRVDIHGYHGFHPAALGDVNETGKILVLHGEYKIDVERI